MIQGTFRWKPIVVSVLITAAMATGWFFLHRYQKRQLQSQFLDLAIRDEDAAKSDEEKAKTDEEIAKLNRTRVERAARFLRHYLLVQPNDVDALLRLANLLEKHAQSPRGRTELTSIYERLLTADPNQNEIRLRSAKLHMLTGKFNDAIDNFKKLPRDGADSAEVHYFLGECYVAKARFAKDKEKEGLGRDAEREFREAIKKAPKKLQAYASLARVLRNDLKQPRQSSLVLKEMIKENPANSHAYLIRAEMLQGNREFTEDYLEKMCSYSVSTMSGPTGAASFLAAAWLYGVALEEGVPAAALDLTKARELEPDKVEVLLVSASHELIMAQLIESETRQMHLKSARTYLAQANTLYPKNSRILSQFANAELVSGHRKEAINKMNEAVEAARDPAERSRLLWDRTVLMLDDENWATHEKAIGESFESMEKLGQEKRQNLTFLRGRLKVRKKEWRAAIELFEGIRPTLQGETNLELQADMLLGFCFEQLGEVGKQLNVYQRAVKSDLFNPLPRFAVARTLAVQNKLPQAIEECRDLRKLPRYVPEADYLYARLLILRAVSEKKEKRDWSEVAGHVKVMEARDTKTRPELAMLRAELAFAQQDADKAKSILRADVIGFNPLEEDKAKETKTEPKTWPDHLDAWVALAALESAEDAMKILDKAAVRFKDPVDVRIAKLRFMPKEKKEAITFLRSLHENVDRYDLAGKFRLLANVAFLYESIEEKQLAAQIWLDLGKEGGPFEKDLRLQLAIFDFHSRHGNVTGMKQAVAKIRDIEKAGGPLGNVAESQRIVAEIMQSTRKPDGSIIELNADQMAECRKARRLLMEAEAKRPSWDRVHLVLADVAELTEDDGGDRAISHLREAVARGNRQSNVISALSTKLENRGQHDEARREYQKLNEKGPITDADLNLRGATLSIINRDFDDALAYTREATKHGRARKYQDYLQQGELFAALGRSKEAEEAFETAKKLAATVPAPWLAIMRLQVRDNKKDKASETFDKMKENLKTLPTASQAHAAAHGHLVLGEGELAEKEFQVALKTVKDDLPMHRAILESLAKLYIVTNKPKQAEPVLRQILEGQLRSGADLQFWARRTLGIALWFQGDEKKKKEGLDAIDENLAKNKRSVDDLIGKATLLATVKGTQEKAIELLQKASEYRALKADQLFLLAQLHERTGKWNNARLVMVKLLSEHDNDIKYRAYLSAYIDMLVSHNEFADADVFRGRLQDSVQSIAKLLLQPKQAEKAGEKDTLNLDRFGAACAILTELARRHPQMADSLFRENEKRLYGGAALTGRTESYLAIAEFLGACRRCNEALDVCEKYCKDLPAKDVVTVGISALGNAIPKDGVPFKRVTQWIEDGKKKNPKLGEWDFYLGALKEREKEYAQAEALYRAVLKRDPENFAAINNLAFLLALRGQGAEANTLIEKAINKLGANADLLDSRAIVLRSNGKLEDAERDIQEALRQERTPYRLFHLAQILDSQGKKGLSDEAFETAKRIGLIAELLHPLERDDFQMRETRLQKSKTP